MFKVVMAAVWGALLCFGSVARGFAQEATGRPFITKWQGKAGEALKFPIVGTDYKLVIKDAQGKMVKSEEKVTVTGTDESYYHAFIPSADGVYTVEAGPEGVKYMRMKVERKVEERKYIRLTSNDQLLEVVQFGTVVWESMRQMFYFCEQMTFAAGIDTPDLTKVTDMSRMFADCASFNQPLNHWDVSKVTDISFMFANCTSFNQPLNHWDVSKVTDMSAMFDGCSAFNQQLEKWDVSQVNKMSAMFDGCSSFNQPLNNWNVSQVTKMRYMFSGCHSFNQPLNNWNVSQVTDMRSMFEDCAVFNQPLDKWTVSQVTNMSWMFSGCSAFNQPLDNWNVGQVTYMREMFSGCHSFNQTLGAWKIKTAIGGLGSTAMSPSNYSATLAGWAAQSEIAANVHFGGDYHNVNGLIYNNEGKAAREALIAKGWLFWGDEYQESGVAITPHSLRLALNEEITLPLEKWGVEEGEKVTLSSDKKEVISYTLTADGKGVHIQGIKNGYCKLTATIAAKAGRHGAYTSTCWVLVVPISVKSISITPASQKLSVNEEVTLVANIFPTNATEKGVMWSSSDSEIATVDEITGKVTAKKEGICTITAQTKEKARSVKGTCTIIVEIVSVTGISVTSPSTSLKVGESVTLTAIVAPKNASEKGVMWSSSDSEIATVDPETGKVTAKKKGTCTITAQTKEEGSSVKGTCTITVEIVSVTGISVTSPSTSLKVGESVTLRVAVAPKNASEKGVMWSSSDSEIATVDPETGKVTAKKKGTCTITAQTKEEGSSVKGTCTISVVNNTVTGDLRIFAVHLQKEGEGTLAIKGYNDKALQTVERGTELTVIATPKAGYTLTSLMAGTQDILATKKFTVKEALTVKAAVTVKAVFKTIEEAPKVAITLAKEGEGTLAIEGYNDETLKAVAVGTELTVTATPKEGYTLILLTAGTQNILATKKFTVTGAATVKAVFKKKENNGGNNGGGNNGGSWQPQKPGMAVEDAVLASLVIAPNPFISQLRIVNPEGITLRYELVTLTGNVVRAGALDGTETVVDTEALPAGLYFVRITGQHGAKRVVKVVKY